MLNNPLDSDSVTTDEDDYGSFNNENPILDEICDNENDFYETDKIDGQYVLGIPILIHKTRKYLLTSSISSNSFFHYSHDDIMEYLHEFSTIFTVNNKLEILKISKSVLGEYNVIIKTFWLKIVQRRWKTIFSKRCRQLAERMTISSIMNFQIRGKDPQELVHLASIRGMMNS